MKVYLEYVDEKSSKFWTIHQEGAAFTVRYGKIGSAGQSKTKEWDSEEKAVKEAEKLIASKRKKGYEDADEPDADAAPAPAAKKAKAKKPAAAPKGVKPDKKVKRPADRTIKSFFKAIREGNVEKVTKAVSGKMPASIRFSPWGDGDERTPLIHALWSNEPAVAQVLLDHGAVVTDTDDSGWTALHHVEDADVCRRLIEGGADVNARTQHGRTPLHCATSAKAVEVARLLIEAGADVAAEANDGATPIQSTTSVPIRDMLIAGGATPPPSPGGEPFALSPRTIPIREIDVSRGTIGVGGDGALWAGSYSGLYRIDGDTATQFADESGNTPSIDAVVAGKNGETYFGTNWGLLRHRDGAFTLYNHQNSPLHDQHLVYTTAGPDGSIYCVGYESESESKHISVFDGETWSVLRPDGDALPTEMELNCIGWRDDEMILGTRKGVMRVVDGAWETDKLDDGIFAPTIYDMSFAGGATWYGTQRGLYCIRDGELNLTKTEHLAQVLCPTDDAMWVGTGYGGIYKFDLASGEQLAHMTEESTGLELSSLESMVRVGDTIWVHASRELLTLRGDTLAPVAPPEEVADQDDGDDDDGERELLPMPPKPFLTADQVPSDLAAQFEQTALEGISGQALLGLLRPAIGFDLLESGEVAVGASKFGGTPDLPSSIEWPLYEDDDDALPFVMQINLAEIHAMDLEGILPASGMLYVFSDTQPDDLMEWKLLLSDAAPGDLSRAALPESLADRRDVDDFVAEFPEHGLLLRGQLTLPSTEFIGARCALTDDDEEAIDGLREAVSSHGDGALTNQLLGWPENVQGEFIGDENEIVLVQLSGYDFSVDVHECFEYWCSDGMLHWVGLRSDIDEGNLDDVDGFMAYT